MLILFHQVKWCVFSFHILTFGGYFQSQSELQKRRRRIWKWNMTPLRVLVLMEDHSNRNSNFWLGWDHPLGVKTFPCIDCFQLWLFLFLCLFCKALLINVFVCPFMSSNVHKLHVHYPYSLTKIIFYVNAVPGCYSTPLVHK